MDTSPLPTILLGIIIANKKRSLESFLEMRCLAHCLFAIQSSCCASTRPGLRDPVSRWNEGFSCILQLWPWVVKWYKYKLQSDTYKQYEWNERNYKLTGGWWESSSSNSCKTARPKHIERCSSQWNLRAWAQILKQNRRCLQDTWIT